MSYKWYTVPSFIDIYNLSNEDYYNLCEGYGVRIEDQKSSGRHYNKIQME